jgi:hypothetical protein
MENHMGLGAAILHCQYTEISINNMGLGAAIPHCQCAEIFAKPHSFECSHFVLSIFRNLCSLLKKMNTEGAIKNGQSRENDNIGYTRRRQTKQTHNKICVGYHYTQQAQIT